MGKKIENFQKKKEYLVCVDSDGCAMDTMDIKHKKCFGPCMIEEWGLQKWAPALLERWNELNLYTITRGINRYKGLAMALLEINVEYKKIDGVEIFADWVEHSDELSDPALKRAIAKNDNICLRKALSWSGKVNTRINELPFEEKKPFRGVKEALAYARQHADIAIVSSANFQAVEEEWELYGLLEYVDLILAQDTGSKAYCIRELIKKGYGTSGVLMVGDARGDYEAAKKNDVFFYPILVRHEQDSWIEFKESAITRLVDKSYGGEYQEAKIYAFTDNLKPDGQA